MQNKTPVIQTEKLSMVYRNGRKAVYALNNLDLTIQPGEIFGYLGPNGAGKTTTIRLLLDLIRPTTGHAHILGMDIQKQAVEIHRHLGFLPGELNLWETLSGREVIEYINRLRGGHDTKYALNLAERLEFDMGIRVRNYSTGNKRKLGLILALMNKPELLILDEPTSGLDPLMQQIFLQLMREVRQEGRTVFLSSHVLNEVQEICDRVGILRSGELKEVKTVVELTHSDFRWITIQFRNAIQPELLASVPGVSELSLNGPRARLKLIGDFDPLIHALTNQYVVDLEVQEPTLEEIFLTYYGDSPAVQNNHKHEEAKS